MKKLFILSLFVIAFNRGVNAQANQSLSNLISPTAINTDMLPSVDNSVNLGSTTFRWKKIYTSGDASLSGLTFGRGGGAFLTNMAAGAYTLNNNSSGIGNTALGYASMYFNQSGGNNCATGYAALYNNTSGGGNTANGWEALFNNTTGYSNTAAGIKALFRSTTQYNLVAVGDSALYNNGTGASASQALYNTAVGSKALFGNTTGNVNTACGYQTLLNCTTGGGNTANGAGALYSNTTGVFNTGNGYNPLYFTTTGGYNTGNGFGALFSNTTGSYNTSAGYGADVNSGSYNNTTIIGSNATGTASNQVRVGSSAVTSIGGFANWTNISDGRVKKNIKDNVPGLAFINKLKPVTYNLDLDAADKIIQRPVITDAEGKSIATAAEELQAKNEKEKIVYSGFVAQQVEQAAKSIGYNFSGVDAAKNDKDLYGLRYAEFVVPLVKAVQELSIDNEQLKTDNSAMKSEIRNLKSEIDELKKAIGYQGSGISSSSTNMDITLSAVNGEQSTAFLSQNIPNPFSSITTINCYIPVNNGNAYINFYSQTGSLLKSVKITGEGKNTITLNANELAAGTYKYVLVMDGKVMDSKTMVIQK